MIHFVEQEESEASSFTERGLAGPHDNHKAISIPKPSMQNALQCLRQPKMILEEIKMKQQGLLKIPSYVKARLTSRRSPGNIPVGLSVKKTSSRLLLMQLGKDVLIPLHSWTAKPKIVWAVKYHF